MAYIGYLKLLGTKVLAQNDEKKYKEVIEDFNIVLEDMIQNYSEVEIYSFNDCAYFEVQKENMLLSFCRCLREKLIEKEIFFNAAICKGELKRDSSNSDNKALVKFLDPSVVKVYGMQSSFSGIGYYLDKEIIKDFDEEEIKNNIVQSIYTICSPESDDFNYRECYDISYGREIGIILETILKNYVKTCIMRRRASRYYITPYTTFLQKITIEKNDDGEKIIDLVMKYAKLIDSRRDRLVLIMILINKIYNESYPDHNVNPNEINYDIQYDLEKIISAVDYKSLTELYKIEDCVLSRRNKNLLSNFIVGNISDF